MLSEVKNPPNPWHSQHMEYLPGEGPGRRLKIYHDQTKNILSKNNSPDIFFDYSVNPYRGCFHGCLYCYARPTHQYLDFGAGTDFERRLVVKEEAPELLRRAFEKKSWPGTILVFSGGTDPYQPIEASYQLTRKCLQVCSDYKNPVGLITKAPLIERDIDVLQELHQRAHLSVTVSIPIWDREMAHAIEPQVATPQRRMRTIERLAAAGLDVGVNVAPIVPAVSEKA